MIKTILLFFVCILTAVSFAQINSLKSDEIFPVELVYFNHAVFAPDSVQLRWGTATESQNYGFDIERKTIPGIWETIGFVEGHGTSNSPKHYTFPDSVVVPNTVYLYRLKQIDIVGTFKYSDTVTVSYLTDIQDEKIIELPAHFRLENAYPNPFNGGSLISYYLNQRSQVNITVYDLQGTVVDVLMNSIQEEGSYSVNFTPRNNLSAGIYFYKIEVTNEKGITLNSSTQKLIYLK